MRLITFQDKYVLAKIEFEKENNRSPVFLNKRINFQEREMYIVNKFIERMKEKINYPKDKKLIPIWCWMIVKSTTINKEVIERHYERFTPSAKNMVLLDLEVPKDGCFVTNFGVWKEILFNLKFNRPVPDSLFEKLFQKQKGAIVQVCIPFIHESFIKDKRYFYRSIDYDYKQTEEEIQEMIKNGELILDSKGNIWSIDDPDESVKEELRKMKEGENEDE